MLMKYMTPREAAEKLRCSRRTIYNHIKAGRLKVYRFGSNNGRILIHEDDLRAFVEGGKDN